ncbi:NusG domain II-containing protein [Caproiciproducens sp. NJN-50]|uniref:NusG domain II-containing protein n=1 Tax=Acutalibacteraceae TaxID=3082771 RepID=UPI000FFE0970|nr:MULTISPECIES: NusG domain II-containing protein [Acutalibacteraceae]QAT49276.1 NusG domain II-containing protein [Caproiciproducens sp. NJN-50]
MKFIKKTDFIILLVLLVVCSSGWLFYQKEYGSKAAVAEIYYESELVETVDLTKGIDRRFSIPQNKHVIFHQYGDGSICFEESNCPDKICIKSGRLKTVGQSAACLPNRIVLKIVARDGGKTDGPDMVIG